ncbi:MAG: PilC/PilY family type IV pilus protein [Rubrivivax sp.]|nr:PilC/PilY family type IV pilus protein [Rubrivivax sp.]
MPTTPTSRPLALRLLQGALATAFAATALVALPTHAGLVIGNNPLYLVMGKANVLMVLDNSNSMDEAASGAAVGSNNAASKSEIARGVIRSLTDTYRSRVNMGLMAYRQNAPASSHLHNSPYDASFDPLTYDPTWAGARSSATKKFRLPNVTSPGNYVYYNVALPFYSANNLGNAFCYSTTANASNDFVNTAPSPLGDSYRCFQTKTGTSNALPIWGNVASETAAGYANYWFSSSFFPTDSDFAQGINDFGRFLTWNYVGPTWYVNSSPGRGYLHIPLKDLDATQATNIKAKLACNVPGAPVPCTATGIPNAGLTPIEGTLLTARDYFKGGWNVAAEGYTAACYPLPESCKKNFVVLLTDGLPSTRKDGTTLADPVVALAEATAAAAALKAEGIETYIIGFALPYGTDPNTLNQVAVAGGTVTAYKADNTATLLAAFNSIFDDIFKKSSAFGSVSQNSTSINTGSMVFQGRFDSTDWSGEVVALQPKDDGTLTMLWNTSDAGRIPAPALRKVFTLVPGVGGAEYKLLADLGAAQQTALSAVNCSATLTGAACAQARIDWARGDRSLEDPVGALRRRTKLTGDVISSSPYYVKATNTLFVGANDGMLHALDATTGNERFAFVPNAVMDRVYKLTSPTYSHEYFVDGEIAVSSTFETPGKNILVSTLGRGGKALFALDVTTPATFSAANVMWEFTDADLGLALGKPVIAKLNNGKTAVIVGNGYNSTNERAVLFIIDIDTGALIRKIDTGAGSAVATNGLATPRGWDADGNGTVDILYAGDLLGNLWKLDLSSANTALWASAFTLAGNPAPMFVATDNLGNRQPITGMIGVGINGRRGDANFGKRYLFLGTGRYITTGDVTALATQSWYGLIDNAAVISSRTVLPAVLKQRTLDLEGTISGNLTRAFSLPVAGDMAGLQGWYIDLTSPVTGAQGERMIGEQKFFGTVLLAASMIPSADVCTPGGQGFLNAVDPFTGAATSQLFFDVNNDLLFDATDRLGGRPIGSFSPDINLPSDAILIGNRIISSGTSGGIRSISVNNPIRSGRISWREVVNQ